MRGIEGTQGGFVLGGLGQAAFFHLHPHVRPQAVDRVAHGKQQFDGDVPAGKAIADAGQRLGGKRRVRGGDVAGPDDPVLRQQPGEIVEIGVFILLQAPAQVRGGFRRPQGHLGAGAQLAQHRGFGGTVAGKDAAQLVLPCLVFAHAAEIRSRLPRQVGLDPGGSAFLATEA